MVKLDLILSCWSSLRWPLPESRKQGFGIIWGSSSSKRCFSFHWIWWCRACLRHPKHINMVYLYPQRDFSVTVNKLKKKKKKKSRCLEHQASVQIVCHLFPYSLVSSSLASVYPCGSILGSSMLLLGHFCSSKSLLLSAARRRGGDVASHAALIMWLPAETWAVTGQQSEEVAQRGHVSWVTWSRFLLVIPNAGVC